MNSSPDQPSEPLEADPKAGGRLLRFWPAKHLASTLAAALVVLLALGSILWPGNHHQAFRGICLVYDSNGMSGRETSLFLPLTKYLGRASGHPLDLVMARNIGEFQAQLDLGADFLICPDGLGLALDPEQFVPLVAGRRTAPRNLRPSCVLVYRMAAGLVQNPWLNRPSRTIFGDSLSLSATGILRTDSRTSAGLPVQCASGPDPYDHSPALHALRLGCFDYALVRQWDAERFFSEGLLPEAEWGMEIMTGPVPDLVLFASRDLPGARLLEINSELTRLGRMSGEEIGDTAALIRSLSDIHLSGFNLLIEPDLDLVRGSFPGDWPPAGQ